MEILQKFKRNGYFTAELYHLLAKKKYVEGQDEIIPSEYYKEMNLTTTERLQSLHNIYIDNNVSCDKSGQPVLSFYPKMIIFQNFKANEKIVAKFSVKNISKAPSFLNMAFKECSNFSIRPCSGQLLSRLAPGISITFAVTFTPAQNEDYAHKVVFHTDTEQYTMPLIAMGPRPIFDFPDRVNIPNVPLKLETHQNITVRNIGLVPAGFTLASKSPFSVRPRSSFLKPDETVIIRIGFKTMRLGSTNGAVYVLFESGEKFRINVHGLTHTVAVQLEKQILRFPDTYNTMARQETFKITNKSQHLLTYMCMKNDCVYNDFEDKMKLATIFYSVKETESEKYRKLVEYDVLSSEEHERVYTRIFFDEIQALVADESLSFKNMHFSVSPVSGQLWPNKSTELTVTFSPKEIGEFNVVAYLDIDGVLDRMPLRLVGKSLPPAINLNLETLDMDRVYINKTYTYEIVAINKGHINGVIFHKEIPSLFGSRITCTPQLHCLKPGDKELFIISFSNSNQGPYFEEVNFVIRDTDVVLKLYLKGVIIYPSLMFSTPCLDFGVVSLGLPKTLEFDVINESIVDVSACLKISSDGPEISSITLVDYAVADRPKPGIPQWPREFDIQPSKLYIQPESRVSVKVTLTANLIRANQTYLEMELEKSDSPPIVLPVKFNALVPEITPAPDIKLRVCFLDHPYKYDVYFKSNDLWGYFTIKDHNLDSTLDIEIGVKEGLIEPNSTICIPIVMKTSTLGTQEFSLQLHLFGCSQPIEICHIIGCGVRPIVTINPMALHWGQVKVATRSQKILTLFNDSPVYVYFKCSLLNKDGKWNIQPSDGFIEPESETELTLNLHLVDADTFTNKAVIQMEKVKDIFIPLSATGVGTSILVGDLRDRVMLGRHFTKIPLNCKVTMENCGSRLHTLEWSEHYKQPKTKQHTTAFFNLEPKIFKITAGEKMDLAISGVSFKEGVIKETWYLVGSIEGINKKELLLECPIVAEFVDPKIEVSAPLIDFEYDYGPYNEFYKLTDIITLKNVSRLPLDMEISVKPPFAMIQKSTTYKVLPEDEGLCGCIYYSQSDLNVSRIKSEVGQEMSKVFIDYLTLKPVEPLRKMPLNFFQDIQRIKMAFNLTHLVEESLEDQEVMKIQVLFDTTKHSSLKSKIYCEVMKIKFKGHKNKDAIKLIGRINFPNISMLTPKLDFQCIMNASIESKTIKIQNVTPLHVCFKFQWRKFAISKNKLVFSATENVTIFPDTISSPGKTDTTAICLHENFKSPSPDVSEIDKVILSERRIKETHANLIEEEQETDLVDPALEKMFMKIRTLRKISPMLESNYDSQFNWTYKFPKVLNYSCTSINNILCLTPHRGILKPNEIQSVHVIFRPKENINVRAVLECEVLGGPSESIVVTGQSSDLRYKINSNNINFKIRSFYEESTEILRITNMSLLPFEYRTYLNEPKFTNELQGTISNLSPCEKVLESEEEIEIKILVRPGVVGYFYRQFLLEIGHLQHIPIEVFGWGVIPQIYVCAERPGIANWPDILGYLAIPSLTTEYLEAINEIFMRTTTSEHLNSPLTEQCYEDPELRHDWHICSFWDLYPSQMDIELAIERFLVISHLQTYPEIVTQYTNSSSMAPIPGFYTTPYVVDFGVVITDSTVRTVIDIINYGPVVVKLHMSKATKIPPWLGLKICGKLLPGETGKMEIGFSPTSLDFMELEQEVETSFNLEINAGTDGFTCPPKYGSAHGEINTTEVHSRFNTHPGTDPAELCLTSVIAGVASSLVPCGVTIPIVIRALCAVPYISTNVSSVNFGNVRCGDKVVLSIPLKNIGKPTCIWYVTLRLKTPGPNPMLILDCSGKYEPGEGGWLNISFKPIMEVQYEALLIFRFHMNPKRMVIPVTGQGISPRVHVIGPNVVFPPTLPWADTTEMYFGLTNPCPFPIELIIAHSDVKWKEEDRVFQLLYKYYNKPDEMLVPALKPGDSFPVEVMSFYKKFTERVQKTIAAEAAATAAAIKSATLSAKKSKSPKTAQKAPASNRDLTPKKRRTESEIIADEMKSMWEENIDPLKECQHVYDKNSNGNNSEIHNKGILIFFHGSPCEEMQSQELAHSVGKGLGIPTINIDLAIVEALCITNCAAKDTLLSCINELYKSAMSATKNAESHETEKIEAEDIEEEENDFDTIWKKIQFLGSERNINTPRTKAGEKKKPKKTNSSTAHNAAVGSTTMFQTDLVHELLNIFFQHPRFHNGFVVESLSSIVLKMPQNTISTVLKCKRSIRNIHMVLCHSDFSKWAAAYEETQREMELLEENSSKFYDDSEIETIIRDFENMNYEEYENSSPELKAIYISYGLEQRRLRHLEKKGPKIKEPLRKDKSGKVIESTLAVASEVKKKAKKEDTKGGKQTSEYIMMNMRYNDYLKNTYENLINIANNWIIDECDVGMPLYGFNGQILGGSQKKGKKKSETEVNIQISNAAYSDRGFPLTMILCPCLRYKSALVFMFQNLSVVKEALKDDEPYDILKCPVKTKEYTVLLPKTFPTIHEEEPLQWRYLDELPIKKCECNPLTDISLIDDSNQENVLNVLAKWHCTCGKKVASLQTSTSEIPSTTKFTSEDKSDSSTYSPLPLRKVKSVSELPARIVLQPNDLVRCKYTFNPQTEGTFCVKRYVEVSGWPESRTVINVTGISDLPRLDSRPKKMFKNFIRRTMTEFVYKLTFLDDLKLFQFGPIFIGKNRIYEEQYTIELKNASLIKAETVIQFFEEAPVFDIDKEFMSLEPACRGQLTVTAAPVDVGEHNTSLILCIKDNPEIVTINISCNGVVPNVQILPLAKAIDYGKLLLYRRQDDRFIVKNDSILPILWKIRNPEEFIEDFVIASTLGIVPSFENQVVPVTYIACRVGIISNKPLIIDIYDSLGRGDPMVVDTLFFTAECYDVLMEYAFENPAENFLNYGNVKVNSTVYQEMYLLNRGKYNIYYKIKKVKNFPEPSLLKTMVFSHSGMIPATMKPVAIEFECTPTASMNLFNIPAFTCSLLDGSKNQVVVAKFPICITIASFYNTFTLFPLGEFNFHVISVGTRVTREVILNNTSKCPITYDIILPLQYQVDPNTPQTPVKGGDKKIKNPPIKCGNFLINNDDNLLASGTSRTIQIQFFATSARKFEETINFIVSDTCPAEAQGVPLRLVGVGAMPTLDFWNLETSFREHLIIRNLSQYEKAEPSPHCVFVEDSVTLHFFCVTVQNSHTATIDLYNNGLVPCALTMKLHYQPNSGPNIFSLDKSDTFIEPLMHKNLGVKFTPTALVEYRAVLEIKLKLLDNQEQSFKICLIGEGVIPRIEMITPNLKQRKMGVLHLPITCLGSVSNKNIVFRNISTVWSVVLLEISQQPLEERLIFWLSTESCSDHMLTKYDVLNTNCKIIIKPDEVATVQINYNPIRKGRSCCDVKLTILDNPFESYTVFCEAEAFMEDVILTGLQMLSMETDLEHLRDGTSTVSTIDTNKKSKSATLKKKKDNKELKRKKSQISTRQTDSPNSEPAFLKYLLDFGGCELGTLQKRTVYMMNNSDKVYKFTWQNTDYITIKPSIGYISPGEEKDIEIMFLSTQPVILDREIINCSMLAVSDDILTMDIKGTTWDNRQCITTFEHNTELSVNERLEDVLEEQVIPPTGTNLGSINMIVLYSAATQYIKYSCHLPEEKNLRDTFIYQTRTFDFKIKNEGKVAMKILWTFQIDEEFPARIDKLNHNKLNKIAEEDFLPTNSAGEKDQSQLTLFSGDTSRESVDTWFEIDLPFSIDPEKTCLKPNETKTFKVTFAPLDAFDYKVRLKSCIDNLDPYDQNVSCKITAKSLIPHCHLDFEESDYLTAGRRKIVGVALPPHTAVLEFHVLGAGCYKKTFNVINPTNEGYEFIFEMAVSDKPELIPVHCNLLKGFVEGGTSVEVTFTFSPTAPGVYESQWKFIIPVNSLVISLLVVGIVKEPKVAFVPNILLIRNSLVGFTTTDIVMLKNSENESLEFEFKGNSLFNESGKTPIVVQPEKGVLKANTETAIKIIYTPIQDGPLSFKIFCAIQHLTKFLTLCVNALSYSINPKITYYLIGNEHILNSEAVTNIHLDQTASTYERRITFTIKNEGSATFFFDWRFTSHPVKRYLQVDIEPKSGHVPPGEEVDCTLHFTLKQVPVEAFPVTLSISDGPEYSIYLYAEIKKPTYRFSCMEYDFKKCIIDAPDTTYKKAIAIFNNDKEPITMDLNFTNLPELVVDYEAVEFIEPNKKLKIDIYFRPKKVKEYEFNLKFWINSLCEENVTIKGEGVPLLFDLYEGCQKSFDLGPVKVGEKIIREIEVMNHSKVAIDASFIFRDMYPLIDDDGTNSDATSVCLSPSNTTIQHSTAGVSRVKMLKHYKDDKIKEQIAMDIQNALSSLKVVPNKVKIKPHRKVPLKIHFKPIGMISKLDVQLNMKVLHFERPLVKLSGSATGMSLCLSQNSLQFGRVRKRGCKVMKVMLMNKGDFGTRFWWQPLISDEFTISPGYGDIAARNNVTFTITFRPKNHNPFIKVWASCNIENYMPLELAMYATCMDVGTIQNKTVYFECPVREKHTEYIPVVNPSDDVWLVLSEVTEGPFETLREFNIEPNSTFEITVKFKPKTIGRHEAQVLYSPLGDSALFVTLVGSAIHPNPNGNISFKVAAKEMHTENLLVHNLTEKPETYIVSTELMKITPEKFDGYYEIKYAETVRAWGEAAATCRWTFICFEECEMQFKVMFINEETREYQFYNITVTVLPSAIVDTVCFTSRARESVQRELLIMNPLSEDAEFYIKCEQLHCPNMLKIGRNSEAKLVLTYSPLVVGVTEEIMEVSNSLSGTYLYKMILKCLPAKEKDLEFTTTFGSSIPLRLRVQNRTETRTEFTSAVSHPSIQTEKKYGLGPLEKGKFLVYYEPTKLGVQHCKVSFDSPIAGEFVFNIKGIATEPKPQGPFDISVGSFTTIVFKNVYNETKTFKINVDTEDFYVKTFYETIKPKKDVKIAVYVSERVPRDRAHFTTGCLTIENCDSPDKIQWTYFLHGVP